MASVKAIKIKRLIFKENSVPVDELADLRRDGFDTRICCDVHGFPQTMTLSLNTMAMLAGFAVLKTRLNRLHTMKRMDR